MMSDIQIIKVLGIYFLAIIAVSFYVLVKRIYDLEQYVFELEKKIK